MLHSGSRHYVDVQQTYWAKSPEQLAGHAAREDGPGLNLSAIMSTHSLLISARGTLGRGSSHSPVIAVVIAIAIVVIIIGVFVSRTRRK